MKKILAATLVPLSLLAASLAAPPADATISPKAERPWVTGHTFRLLDTSSRPIAVFSDTRCSAGRRIVQVGDYTRNVGSWQADRVHRWQVAGGAWRQVPSNVCSGTSTPGHVKVHIYNAR